MHRAKSVWRRAALLLWLAAAAPLPGLTQEFREAPPEIRTSADSQQKDCSTVQAALEEQNRKLQQELRQIKRELSLLNQNLEKPGAREVIAGVGFILGLFGAVALGIARRRPPAKGEH